MKNKNILIAIMIVSVLMTGIVYSTEALPSDCLPDNTAPSIDITYPDCGQTFTTSTIEVIGTADDDTEISNVTISVESEPWQLANGTTSWSATVTLIPGQNIITAKATDTSGNTNEKSIIAIYGLEDNTPPQILEMWPPLNAIITTNNLELGLVTDENATCKYDTYDTDYDSMNNTFFKTDGTEHRQSLTLADGTYTYYVRCMDAAGHCTGSTGNKNTESKSTTFTVNTTPIIIVYDHDVSITEMSAPATTTVGDIVSVSAVIKNIGKSNETEVPVIFSVDGVPIQTQYFNLTSMSNEPVSFNWSALLGNHNLSLFANLETDGNLLDNNASASIFVFSVYDHDISITGMSAPATATVGNVVSISAILTNNARSDETEVPVIFSVDNIPIQTKYYNLTSQMNTLVAFNWTAVLGTHGLLLFANLTTDGNLLDNNASASITVNAVPVPPPSGGGGGGGSGSSGGSSGGSYTPPPVKNNNNATFSNISIPDSIKYGETLYVSGCVSKLGKNSTVEAYLDGALKASKKAVVPSICFNLSAGVPNVGNHKVYLWLNSSNIDVTKYITVNETKNETSVPSIEISDIVINGTIREGISTTIRLPIKTSKLADASISLFSDGVLIGQTDTSINESFTASFDYTFKESGKKTLRAFAYIKDGGQDMMLKEITVEKNMPTGSLFSSIIRNPYVIALLLLILLVVIYYYATKKPETSESEESKIEA